MDWMVQAEQESMQHLKTLDKLAYIAAVKESLFILGPSYSMHQ